MTVKRVIFPFVGGKIGGSHISAFALGQALQKEHGVEIVVAAPADSLIAKVASEAGFTVWPLAEKPVVRHWPLAELWLLLKRLRQLSKQPAYTIVHCNDIAALQSWGPAARLLGLPVVYHSRALNRNVLPNLIVIGLAHIIICISQSVEDHLPIRLRRRSVRIDDPFIITPPADPAGIRKGLFAKWDVTDDGPLIGFVGNFVNRKRPRFFLEMARELLKEHASARFVFFGREVDDTEEDLRTFAKELGIADRVIFAGFQFPVENNIAVLDVLAIPALNEPLGRTPIEALLIGTPYVACDDAGLAETGRRFGGGRLVPANATPGEFAREVGSILTQPLRTMNFDAARERARTELSASHHGDMVMKAYREMLGLTQRI